MLSDLTTTMTTISTEQLDALFEGTPAGTPSAESVGKTVDTKPVEIPQIDLEAIDKQAADAVANEEKEKAEGKKDEKVVVEEGKDKPIDTKEVVEDKKDAAPEVKVDNSILKNTVDYLVQKGIFKDFEGRENLEITEEVYAELLEAQIDKIVDDRYNVKKSSAGEEGKAILDFLENGGDPDVIVELFKEKREIAQFGISTEDQQKELVSKYYKDVLGWKPERIKRQIDYLATQEDALKNEAGDIKEKYEEHFNTQKQQLEKQQSNYVQEQKRRQQAFETSIKSAINDYSGDTKIRQNLQNSLFKFKTLQDGTQVNEFYLKFAEWQNDPKKYIELTEFITDHDNYLKRKKVEAQNEANEKTFKFIKGNQTVSKNKGSEHTEIEDTGNYKGTNFSVIFK